MTDAEYGDWWKKASENFYQAGGKLYQRDVEGLNPLGSVSYMGSDQLFALAKGAELAAPTVNTLGAATLGFAGIAGGVGAVSSLSNTVVSLGRVMPLVPYGLGPVGSHALLRMSERGVTPDQVQSVIEKGERFLYFHEGVWKTGYYDSATKIFVGRVGDVITTVIANVKPKYIENLKRLMP